MRIDRVMVCETFVGRKDLAGLADGKETHRVCLIDASCTARTQGSDQLLISGVTTGVCVTTTMRGGAGTVAFLLIACFEISETEAALRRFLEMGSSSRGANYLSYHVSTDAEAVQ